MKTKRRTGIAGRAIAVLLSCMLFAICVLSGWGTRTLTVHAAKDREYQTSFATMVWSEGDNRYVDWAANGHYGQYYLRTTADDSDTRMIYLKWDITNIPVGETENVSVRLSHNSGTPGAAAVIAAYPAAEKTAQTVSMGEVQAVSAADVQAVSAGDGEMVLSEADFMTWDNKPDWDSSRKIAEFTLCADDIPSAEDKKWAIVSFDITEYFKELKEAGKESLYIVLRSETVDPGIYESIRGCRPWDPVQDQPALVISDSSAGGGQRYRSAALRGIPGAGNQACGGPAPQGSFYRG